MSGCLSAFTGETNNAAEAEDIAGVLDIYELNIFVPTVKGVEKIVESGTYFVDSDSSAVQVIRLVNDQKEVSLLKDSGLFSFEAPEFTEIYFITAENFTMTEDGIAVLLENPAMTDLAYTLEGVKRSPTIKFEENFTGVLVYTFRPHMGGTSIYVNDGADAIQIILPDGLTTGSRIIGTASPTPDSFEEDENGRDVLKWNSPMSSVNVKYYSENAPFYLLISFSALVGAIIAVFLWYRYQIKKLHKITNLIDDEKSGFRKQQ
ncbi:DUF5803 family protein [Methanimicrococcus blatticola]|uniref:DUF5803 family protein n=1 Tax=Methanimicrococcus blatticola TaxID=91560 RepID=UPI00105C850A|nr:DUF5803 family protein [Methanimicrococcus blatticola]MBZ3936150.1 hypothetical protein [Methanimicrococcus blatticola]MCC2508393.1 DUF5803 family protein [Methanimicrococcus blatticola]